MYSLFLLKCKTSFFIFLPFQGDFLIGPDLLKRRPPPSGDLPSLGGPKHSAEEEMDSAEVVDEVASAHRALSCVIAEERAALGHRLVTGVWRPDIGRVELQPPSSRGNFSRVLGCRPCLIDAQLLFPEEALYLMETESLLVRQILCHFSVSAHSSSPLSSFLGCRSY